MKREVPWPTPGEILLEEFLKPMDITQYRLAKEIKVSQIRIGEIIAGKRSITADTGLRLAKFFGTSEGFWTGLQDDFARAQTKVLIQKTLSSIKSIKKQDYPAALNSKQFMRFYLTIPGATLKTTTTPPCCD